MINLWDIDKGNTYNISQRGYVDFSSFNCVNKDKVWVRPFFQRNQEGLLVPQRVSLWIINLY